MNPIHPKLTWGEFERVRAKRKRRKFWLWFGFSFGLLALVGASMYWVDFKKDDNISERTTEVSPTNREQNQVINPEDPGQPLPKETTQPVLANPAVRLPKKQAPTEKLALQVELSPKEVMPANRAEEELTTIAEQEGELSVSQLSPVNTPAAAKSQQDVVKENVIAAISPADTQSRASEAVIYPAGKKAKRAVNVDSWLMIAWIPWHSAELRSAEQPATGSFNYRPLNSFNLTAGINVFNNQRLRVSFEPQYMLQRFQTQSSTTIEAYQIAPGSIVGYVQDFKGIQPIFSDTLRGTSTVQSYANGVQQELLLPFSLSTNLWSRGKLNLGLHLSTGLHYVFVLRAKWFNQAGIYDLNPPANRLGVIGSGGLQLQYQPGNITYQLGMNTFYRTAVSRNQLPWRNQIGVSIGIPLTKRN